MKISVIIPVFKVEKYIAATIQSVLNQTFKDFELLIINDGSPDRSMEICQQFTDPRIKMINQENAGVAAARNHGIRVAQGEYIALLDADDLWVPEKLAKHMQHLDNSPSVGVSFSRSTFIDEADNPVGIYQMSKLKDITTLDLLCRTPIGNGSVAVIRKEVFEEIKLSDCTYFDEDRQLHPSEDVECWLRIALLTDWEIEGLAEPLTLYRLNSQGFSAQLAKKFSSWETLIAKAKIYSPETMTNLEKPAIAYQLRHLARRAVSLGLGSTAVELMHRALTTYWVIIFEEPARTLITLSAAYSLYLLPRSIYQKIEDVALKVAGNIHQRRMIADQSQQIAKTFW